MNDTTKFLDTHLFYDPGDFADIDVTTYAGELLQQLARASVKNGYPLAIGTVVISNEKTLRTSAVSSQHQTNVIREVRSILGLKKGDRIEWVLRNGEIIVRKAKK